jgi:hypothetical protein
MKYKIVVRLDLVDKFEKYMIVMKFVVEIEEVFVPVEHMVEKVLVVLVVEQKMKYKIVVRLDLVDKKFEKYMIVVKFVVEL